MRCLCTPLAIGVGLALAGAAAFGQSAAPSPSPPASPCTTPEHRQFDFWVGDWNVRDPQGQIVGTNHVTLEYGDCVLQEHWVASGGGHSGSSFNIYWPGSGRWHQTWVDTNGALLLFDGELRDGKMQFTGETPMGPGKRALHQLSFEPLPEGKVRQLWQSSRDEGKTWNVVFDGFYERQRD